MIEEITITVDGTRVVGLLDAAPDSVTVEIQSTYKNLKAGIHISSFGLGFHRFVQKGKINPSAIQDGKGILKELFLAGKFLEANPEFIQRLRKYLRRFEKQSAAILQARDEALSKFKEGEMNRKEYEARVNELKVAEHQNVIEKGNIFRQYGEELTRQSGGRADSRSILDFEAASPSLV